MGSFMNLGNEPPIELNAGGTSGEEHSATHYFGRYPLFSRISIETLSFCNRTCSFCPLAWSQDERGRNRMSDALYANIVEQLGVLEFKGVAQMFLLSEPTIDTSIKSKLRALREACPKVTTYISSNGDLFDKIDQTRGREAALVTIDALYESGLTTLNLNIYDEGPAQAERFTSLINDVVEKLGARRTEHKYSRHRGRRIALTDMRIETNESQNVTNVLYIKTKAERVNIVAPRAYCARTQRHLVIEWDGAVPICCAIDVTDKSLPQMGNANTTPLLQIWNSEAMNRYRWFTQQARRVLPGCNTCTHKMAFPHVVRKVQPDEALAAKWESELP